MQGLEQAHHWHQQHLPRNITDRMARGEHGPGCFIIHKPDLGCYRIEGINQAQVQLGEKRLRAHIDQVIASQNPTRTTLMVLRPSSDS